MNATKIAAALRLLADAIEGTPEAPTPEQLKRDLMISPKPRGRPPGSVNKPAVPTADALPKTSASAPGAATPAAPAPASQAGSNNALTHAIVANDFKAAALAHGRDFVKGLLTAHNAPTFDKVTDLATFQAQLKAGPQAAPAATVADDLLG